MSDPSPAFESLLLSDLQAELALLEEQSAEMLEDIDDPDGCPCCVGEELDRINTRIEELIGLIEGRS